jgi:serine/threonine protein phosphatase 1
MIIFVISDIHSHYDEMILSLETSGYDEKNDQHHLVVLGDLFDRGPKTKEVLEYLYNLHVNHKCTIVLGNHDVFLLELMEENYDRTLFNIKYNGHGETLNQLSGISPNINNLSEVREKILRVYPYLYEWISSFPHYYELGNYIFVHGGINGDNPSWRETTSRRNYTWNKQHELPGIEGKTIVCGHTRTAVIREKSDDYKTLLLTSPKSFDILYENGKIFIDAFVEISKKINVLKLQT